MAHLNQVVMQGFRSWPIPEEIPATHILPQMFHEHSWELNPFFQIPPHSFDGLRMDGGIFCVQKFLIMENFSMNKSML